MTFIIVVLAVIILLAVASYNSLQKLSQNVKEAFSNVQVAISKKLSLINQLVDTVKNYQEGEQFTLLKISEDSTNTALMASYQQAGTMLTSVQGLAEKFPNLKASDQYQILMRDIKDCELDIQKTRQTYNSTVKAYNSKRSKIPTVFIAQLIGFSIAPYMQFDISGNDATSLKEFKTDDGERLQQLFKKAGTNMSDAAKSLTNHAGDVTKMISNKINKKEDALYYYYVTGGVPKGPKPLFEIRKMIEDGTLESDVKVASDGSDEWQILDVDMNLKTDSAQN